MATMQADEETPLLDSQHPTRSPLPWSQLTLLLLLQLAEPLTSSVIYPFAPQLVRDIGITDGNESRVGYYVGLMNVLESRSKPMSQRSSKYGLSHVASVCSFTLYLQMEILAMMAEFTDLSNIAQVYAFMPIPWSVGGALGPIIGGSLARPADRFPKLFGHNDFLKKYPYFLPCAVPAAYAALVWILTLILLKETLESPLSISGLIILLGEKLHLTEKRRPNGSAETQIRQEPGISEEDRPLPLRGLLIPRVMTAAGNYAILSLVDIAFRAIQPLFLSTPIALGGLGLAPPTIGKILSVYGVFNGIVHVFFFAPIHNRLGSKITYISGVATALPCFLMFPFISQMAKSQGMSGAVWVAVIIQTLLSIGLNIAAGAIFMFITAASPNRASLGGTNGLCQMSVSAMRAIGPAVTNSLFSLSIEHNYLHGYFVYYFLATIVCVAIYIATFLPRTMST
ncbi:hypothetical protein H0H92_008033 [Tricholoma furcatifolium]|nr:hypothetical protein H0H92_008033 [Tricholoma furcatifolium]